MSAKTKAPLTPRQRLSRGLTHTAVGPIDVTRGVVGLGFNSAQAGASSLRRRYREGQLSRQLALAQETIAQELATAQEAVTGLPAALQDTRRSHLGKRPWILAGAATAIVAGGAIAFAFVRRSSRPEPSSRPPSVDVQSKP
jgi:hypothetical protein